MLLGSRNMHLLWTTWGLAMPFRPSAHWPTNWKSLICSTARLGEVIFIPCSYGIFYLTAKSLLHHRKKIVLITWLLAENSIFSIWISEGCNNFILLYTVLHDHCIWIWPYHYMIMITAFSIFLQLHGILLISVLLKLDFTYLVVLVIVILQSNLKRTPKICMHFKEKSIPPCQADPPAHVHVANFHIT